MGYPLQQNDISYQAEDGMTWGEWVDSEYNTDGAIVKTNNGSIVEYNTYYPVFSHETGFVSATDEIVPNIVYTYGE